MRLVRVKRELKLKYFLAIAKGLFFLNDDALVGLFWCVAPLSITQKIISRFLSWKQLYKPLFLWSF
ncbi:MAG: hypothetical protein ACI9XB_002823 [Gammaproteobacteria bacterium]|jgi:hypothetical protein